MVTWPTDLSPLGAHFMFKREALVLVPYTDGHMPDPRDPTKQVVRYSIGFGCLAKHGERTPPISVKKGFHLFHQAVESRIQTVRWAMGLRVWTKPPVPVLQRHLDAVCALYFQGGSDGLKAVSALIREGNLQGAADEFLRWDTDADGVQRTALYGRRQLERDLFLTGDYGVLNPIRLYRGNPRTTHWEDYYVTPEDLKGWTEPGAEDDD